jgi:hypothetical protein
MNRISHLSFWQETLKSSPLYNRFSGHGIAPSPSLLASSRVEIVAKPDEDGWVDWRDSAPPLGVLIQIRHWMADGEYTNLGMKCAEELTLSINRYALSWRLTGIGREQLAACSEGGACAHRS